MPKEKQPTANLITYRAFGPLLDNLQQRAGAEANRAYLSQVAQRDGERYYHALASALKTITLTEAEALLICDALNGTLMEPHTMQLLWAQIDDACRLDNLCEKWDCQREVIVDLLRDLSYCQSLAVVDAVERWWLLPDKSDRRQSLRAVGLLR